MKNRTHIFEAAREIPVFREVDVLVAGAGPAGCAAAVTAARSGAKTLLIDALNAPGGMTGPGMMSHFTGTVDSKLYEEVLHRNALKNQGNTYGVRSILIEPTRMILTWIEILEEAGAEMLFNTYAAAPLIENGRIVGIIIENKDGRSAILASIVIDATGDGDMAARAGCSYTIGREEDSLMQPATLMFKVGGVNMDKAVFPGTFETTVETEKGELQQLASEKLPSPAGHVLLYKSPIPGIVTVNMTNCIGVNGTTAEDQTKAEILCRKQIPAIIEFLREYVPGYEECYVMASGSMIGIRETRHFKGLYTLTQEDILNRRVFDDWVVKGAEFNFDVHNLTGSSLDKTGMQAKFPKNTKYTIPYRCLIPEGILGLLLAGRNISGTHMAHSNYRVMPICIAIGEAAGFAAAWAAQRKCELTEVPVREIQKALQ